MTNVLDAGLAMLRASPANHRALEAWAELAIFQPRIITNPATLAEIERQNQLAKESVL